MCGKERDLFITVVEGAEIVVCKNCCEYGKILKRVSSPVEKKEKIKIERKKHETIIEPEVVEMLVSNYANKIKEKREKLGLKQNDFAKLLKEKESLIHNIETGKFEPGPELAKKIGNFLKINLLEKHQEKKQDFGFESGGAEMTLGDFIKIKKR